MAYFPALELIAKRKIWQEWVNIQVPSAMEAAKEESNVLNKRRKVATASPPIILTDKS